MSIPIETNVVYKNGKWYIQIKTQKWLVEELARQTSKQISLACYGVTCGGNDLSEATLTLVAGKEEVE